MQEAGRRVGGLHSVHLNCGGGSKAEHEASELRLEGVVCLPRSESEGRKTN